MDFGKKNNFLLLSVVVIEMEAGNAGEERGDYDMQLRSTDNFNTSS